MKKIVLFIIALILFSCLRTKNDARTVNFPRKIEPVSKLPSKENFWIFILAGQSNMAGRGMVESVDTISSERVYALNKDGEWVLAKEPLHYYEPNLTGLDCGLTFGKELSAMVNDSIYIGIVPCAVGGSSIQQWLGDSLHRQVKLFSNFKHQVERVSNDGIIKGILWHQGESNAHQNEFKGYKENLTNLFSRFRAIVKNDSLPILVGELGSFLTGNENGHYKDSVNRVIKEISEEESRVMLINTSDLKHKGDTLHFDSYSQRLMGKRFAEAGLGLFK